MYLATTLTTETNEDLRMIVRLYSWRWGIETFFWKFKQALGANSWRVFSSWDAIDRLLTAAHMAYFVLVLMMEFAKRGSTAAMRELMDRLEEVLRSRFARPVEEMTLGRFLRLITMDFPSPCRAGSSPRTRLRGLKGGATAKSSGAREFHPRALPEPDGNSSGLRALSCRSQSHALISRVLNLLYFRRAQRTRKSSNVRRTARSAEGRKYP